MKKVGLLFAYLLLVLAINWPHKYETLFLEVAGATSEFRWTDVSDLGIVDHYFAGWPGKFYYYGLHPGSQPVISFDILSLLVTVTFWAAIPLVIFAYKKIFAAQSKLTGDTIDVPKKRRRRNVKLVDIFIITALAAAAFGWWKLKESRVNRDRQLSIDIVYSGGATKMSVLMPKFMKRVVDILGTKHFTRISSIYLRQPSNELLAKAVESERLQTLVLTSGEYPASAISKLADRSMLTELAIAGRKLDVDLLKEIAGIETLRCLNLMRTNISAGGLMALGRQPRLMQLNLIHTDVRLSELKPPPFAENLQILILPHPGPGEEDQCVLEAWPRLSRVQCNEFDEWLNHSPLQLTFRDLPQLKKIEVDALQKIDIVLENLPLLESVDAIKDQWIQRTSASEIVPGYLWVRKLKVANSPNLKSLAIFCGSLEELSINAVTPMQIEMSVFNISAGRNFREPLGYSTQTLISTFMGQHMLSYSELPKAQRQKWIDDLGKCSGIWSLNLAGVPVRDLDLTPLDGKPETKRINFMFSDVLGSQWTKFKALPNLDELCLMGTKVRGLDIATAAAKFPGLRRIEVDSQAIDKLRLENFPNLENLQMTRPLPTHLTHHPDGSRLGSPLTALRLINTPKLKDHFCSEEPLVHLHLENMPSLEGFSVTSPIPKDSVIRGVRNLQFFSAGGPHCGDEIVSEVLECKNLERLTIAYSSATSKSLLALGDLKELSQLYLTGTPLDDVVVEKIGGLKNLFSLRLDYTTLPEASIVHLHNLKDLTELDLNGLKIDPQILCDLVDQLPKLRRLGIAGAKLSPDLLKKLNGHDAQKFVDLSGCRLSAGLFSAMLEQGFNGLSVMSLKNCVLDNGGFSRLIQQDSNILFYLENAEVSPLLVQRLMQQNRIIDIDAEGITGISSRDSSRALRMDPRDARKVGLPGDVDPMGFRPATKSLLNF